MKHYEELKADCIATVLADETLTYNQRVAKLNYLKKLGKRTPQRLITIKHKLNGEYKRIPIIDALVYISEDLWHPTSQSAPKHHYNRIGRTPAISKPPSIRYMRRNPPRKFGNSKTTLGKIQQWLAYNIRLGKDGKETMNTPRLKTFEADHVLYKTTKIKKVIQTCALSGKQIIVKFGVASQEVFRTIEAGDINQLKPIKYKRVK